MEETGIKFISSLFASMQSVCDIKKKKKIQNNLSSPVVCLKSDFIALLESILILYGQLDFM